MVLLTTLPAICLITAFACASFFDGVTATYKQNLRSHHPSIKRQIQKENESIQTDQIAKNSDYAAERLRSDLLEHYDPGTYPWNSIWNVSTNNSSTLRKGVPVGVDINLHKVLDVNAKESKLDLLVWFRLSWPDPRLAWNPDDYGGLESTWFYLGKPEWHEIWSPDLVLWNQDEELLDSLSLSKAKADFDGTVYWSRPGHLQPSCRLEGLNKFPFDELKCTMEFGSWTHSGLYIRPYAMNGGANIGGSVTSAESFNEYSLKNLTVEELVYPPFPIAPEEDWPVLLYHVIFSRNWEPYARGYLLVQILLNLVAFIVFWLPPESGERMGLAVTALLAGVASELVVGEKLPLTTEWTWISQFSLGSLIFATLPLFESALVLHLYQFKGDNIWHLYVIEFLTQKFKKMRKSRTNESSAREPRRSVSIRTSIEGHMTEEEKLKNIEWRKLGLYIDEIARIVFPFAYIIWILVFFT